MRERVKQGKQMTESPAHRTDLYIQSCGPAGATPRNQLKGKHSVLVVGVVLVGLFDNHFRSTRFVLQYNDHRDCQRIDPQKSQKQGDRKPLRQVDARPG